MVVLCFRYQEFIGNKECDDSLNHKECCFDGGDCPYNLDCALNCPHEITKLGDAICDNHLNILDCCFDAGDCLENYGLL